MEADLTSGERDVVMDSVALDGMEKRVGPEHAVSEEMGGSRMRVLCKRMMEETQGIKSRLRVLKSSFKFISKLFRDLQSSGVIKKSALTRKNFSVKKFIGDIPLAEEILFETTGLRLDPIRNVSAYISPSQNSAHAVLLHYITEIEITLGERSSEEKDDRISVKESPATFQSLPCKSGCGFYGHSDTDGYCSLCYKKTFSAPKIADNPDVNVVKNSWKAKFSRAKKKVRAVCAFLSISSSQKPDLPTHDAQDHRCRECQKKITMAMASIICKCGFSYCMKHRSVSSHKCDFNHRVAFKKKLQDNNPSVESKKLDKI